MLCLAAQAREHLEAHPHEGAALGARRRAELDALLTTMVPPSHALCVARSNHPRSVAALHRARMPSQVRARLPRSAYLRAVRCTVETTAALCRISASSRGCRYRFEQRLLAAQQLPAKLAKQQQASQSVSHTHTLTHTQHGG